MVSHLAVAPQFEGCDKACSREQRFEHHLAEMSVRRTVLVDLGAQHGAFPCVDQECGKYGWRYIVADVTSQLSFANTGLDRARPAGIDRRQTVANEVTLVGHIGAKISDKTAAFVVTVRKVGGHGIEVTSKAFDWGVRMVAQDAQRRARGALPVFTDYLRTKRFLAVKMIVERALWHARRGGDVVHAAAIEAAAPNRLYRGVQYPVADVGSCHALNMTSRLGIVKWRQPLILAIWPAAEPVAPAALPYHRDGGGKETCDWLLNEAHFDAAIDYKKRRHRRPAFGSLSQRDRCLLRQCRRRRPQRGTRPYQRQNTHRSVRFD